MELFPLRPHRHEGPPPWVGVLIASWVLLLVGDDSKSGLPVDRDDCLQSGIF